MISCGDGPPGPSHFRNGKEMQTVVHLMKNCTHFRRWLTWLAPVVVSGYLVVLGPSATLARSLPKFQIKLVDGTVVNSKDLVGGITVIDFWGTWCKPCLEEIPAYNEFYKAYREKGVRFMALAVDSGTEVDVREASKRLKIEYPVAALTAKQLDSFPGISVFPTTWIVNPQGKIQEEIIGTPKEKHKTLREVVDRLLQDRTRRSGLVPKTGDTSLRLGQGTPRPSAD